ncbi:MAG: DUF1080 domain-containing protein [Planctomycetes bacterium]|nr:DUF1080 domain-containing protein [Planctomycetota bacterium]MBL7041573.1 DUF1080 domain-containing protein [Pirellulaceae bacterium]
MRRFHREQRKVTAIALALAQILLFLNTNSTGAQQLATGEPVDPSRAQLPFPRPVQPVEGFTAHGGTWVVKDGELWASAGPGPKLVCDTPTFSVGEVGVEVLLPDDRDGNAALIARVSEAGVGADKFVGYEIALDARRQVLRLGRHRHNFELIRDVPCRVPVGQWISLVARLGKTSLEVLVDGKSVLRHDDGAKSLPAGAVGLRPWQREARYRNLWVETGGSKRTIPFQKNEGFERASELLTGVHLPAVAFFTRHPLSRPNTISCAIWQSQPSRPGCSIRVFDPLTPDEPARTVFGDPDGCIFDMNVSFDARTLLFSYRGKGEKYWHIYRIGADGQGLCQLTDGPFNDVSPMALPDGDIVFVSTRRGGYTLCQPGPASNLFRISSDGSNIRCVSMNTLADFSPQMLPDGRVLFTRWEYIDRDLTYRQSLWTQNPDGTSYQLFFGNTIRDVGTFWQARPLPGHSDMVVATFAPHHGWPHGAIGLITNRFGLEAPRGKGFAWITKEFPEIGDRSFQWSYRDPFPLGDSLFLVSYAGGGAQKFRIFLLDVYGNKRPLYEDPEFGCYNPLPLRPAVVPPVIPTQGKEDDTPWGTYLLVDAYRGLNGIEHGRAKYLRIVEQVRKTEDLVSRAFDQSPVMSYATYYAKRSWGTVPLAEDGSAYFKVPALREIYFQILDAEGRELQRMTSGSQVMPGQTVTCIGCHEPRSETPPIHRLPLAANQPPRQPERLAWLKDGIVDFPTVVQPVLDKYCVRCHGGTNPDGGLLLTGDKTRLFNMAYDNLLGRSRSYRQHDMATGEMLAAEGQKEKPLVHFYWLLRTPTAVNQPLWTGSHASRLLDYVDTDHCEQQIPLEDRQRIYLWIDANVPYYGTYAHSRPRSPGRRDLCTDSETGRESAWFAQDFLGVYNGRCQSCHGALPHPNNHAEIWDGRLAWINFTNPQLSPALTAHLAADAGGRGISTSSGGPPKLLFTDTTDADYQRMLKAIETGKQLMIANPTADMPGFKFAKKEP